MKLKPLNDRILVKRIEEKKRSKGGIIIPDIAKEKPLEGIVVAVGDGILTKDGKRRSLAVKAGDQVIFSKYSGEEFKMEEDEHMILREEEVLAIIEQG